MNEKNYQRLKMRFLEARFGVGIYDALDGFEDGELVRLCQEIGIPEYIHNHPVWHSSRELICNALYSWKTANDLKGETK